MLNKKCQKRKKLYDLWKGVLLALFLVFSVCGMQTEAKESLPVDKSLKIKNLEQIGKAKSDIQLKFDEIKGISIFNVRLEDSNGNVVHEGLTEYDRMDNSVVIADNVKSGKNYTFYVKAMKQNGWKDKATAEGPEASIKVVTAPARVTNLVQTTGNTITSISLKWDMMEGTNKYRISWKPYNAPNSEWKDKITTSTSLKITGLKKNTKYNIAISARNICNDTGFVAESSGTYLYVNNKNDGAAPLPTKITGVKLSSYDASTGKVKIKWDKRAAASGYQYQVYTHDGEEKIASGHVTKTSVTLTNKLSKDMFYKVRVRGYRLVNNGEGKVYGGWSQYKYISLGISKITVEKSSGKLKMKWNKVDGATKYAVYVSTSKPDSLSDMRKVGTTKNKSLSINSFNGSKISTGKTYYIAVVPQKVIGENTISGLSTTVKSIKK